MKSDWAKNDQNTGLGRWIAVSLGLFVISGSLILVWWMHAQGRKDSRNAFAILAEANAEFIVDSKLPKSEQLGENLSEILKIDVRFRKGRAATADLRRPGFQLVVVELDAGWSAEFSRPVEGFWDQFRRRQMWMPLGLFWGLCLVLAWAISRRVVRPLVALSENISSLGSQANLPELKRKDEIGHLARTLVSEREQREAAERLALLGKMATGLAHEIKNPVAAIQMHAQLLGDEGGESAAVIVLEGRRIEGLVNQWMFLARPEPPKRRLQDVRVCLGEVLDSVSALAVHAGVKVVRGFGAAELEWEIDSDRMAQVFRNLAMNAVHAMPSGGELHVTIEPGVAVVFSDAGKGFSEEALQRWGELFFSTKEGGMGIGLSVAAEIVRAHGGELRVENGSAGAVVSVTL